MSAGREDLKNALAPIPEALSDPLIADFELLLDSYRLGHWEAVGIRAGKICEHIYMILEGFTSGVYADAPSKPRNMVDACKALEKADPSYGRSVRIQMPRIIIATYELRNNRGIGHVSGELDPNHMDAEFLARSAKWLLAELVRVFSGEQTGAAQSLIEALSERSSPIVWSNDTVIRVLDPEMPTKDRAVVALYTAAKPITSKELCSHVEYKNLSRFRSSVLRDMTRQKLIEYSKLEDKVELLPPGATLAERWIRRLSR